MTSGTRTELHDIDAWAAEGVIDFLGHVGGDDFVVVGSNWGQAHHPAWSGNLLADPTQRSTEQRQGLAHRGNHGNNHRDFRLAGKVDPAALSEALEIKIFRSRNTASI